MTRQRRHTACWQLSVSTPITGGVAPGMPPKRARSRRNRYAPATLSGYALMPGVSIAGPTLPVLAGRSGDTNSNGIRDSLRCRRSIPGRKASEDAAPLKVNIALTLPPRFVS